MHTHTHAYRWRSVDEHRRGTGTRAGTKTIAVAEMGTGKRMERGQERGRDRGGRRNAKKRKRAHKSCRHDQALSFRTRHHLCKQVVVLASTRQLRSHGPVSLHAQCTDGLTGFEGREGEDGVGGGIGIGGGSELRAGSEMGTGSGGGGGGGSGK